MHQLVQKFSEKSCKQQVPDLRPGYQVRVHQKIKEGEKERIQVFQGMVISVNSGNAVSSSFTVRKVSEGVGVEKVFPIHSPNIMKIEVQRAHKVRRAKLHFLRDLAGKALRLKEVPLNLQEKTFETTDSTDNADSTEKTEEEVKVKGAGEETTESVEEATEEKVQDTEETIESTDSSDLKEEGEEKQEETPKEEEAENKKEEDPSEEDKKEETESENKEEEK